MLLSNKGILVSAMFAGVKNEGWFDSWMLLHAFKKKVLSMGVRFIEGEVTGVNVEDKRVNSVKVHKLCCYGCHPASSSVGVGEGKCHTL